MSTNPPSSALAHTWSSLAVALRRKRIYEEAGFIAYALLWGLSFFALEYLLARAWASGLVFSTSTIPRETIIPWSIGLAQISFGLVAATLAVSIPHYNKGLRAFDELANEITRCRSIAVPANLLQSLTGPAGLNEQSAPAQADTTGLAMGQAIDTETTSAGQAILNDLTDCARMVELSTLEEPLDKITEHIGRTSSVSRVRTFSSAATGDTPARTVSYFLWLKSHSLGLQRSLSRLQRNAAAILVLSSLVGTTGIGFDPFWWVLILSHRVLSRYPLPEDYYYPELPLWLLGTVYLFLVGYLLYNTLDAGASLDRYSPDLKENIVNATMGSSVSQTL